VAVSVTVSVDLASWAFELGIGTLNGVQWFESPFRGGENVTNIGVGVLMGYKVFHFCDLTDPLKGL